MRKFKRIKKIQQIKGNTQKQSNVLPVIRFTVDDPVNDIFDDDVYDDEGVVILKEKANEKENFEKPW